MVTRAQDIEREISVLKYLKDHRVLSIDQIARRFWTGQSLRSPKVKLAELATRGLVHSIKFARLRASSHYSLTPAGFSLLKSHGLAFEQERAHLSKPTCMISGNFEHHSRVADLRIALETSFPEGTLRWIPEIVIWQDRKRFGLHRMDSRDKRLRSRIPDGIIAINDRSMVFEYEHASYRRGKFYQIIETWEGIWKNYRKLIVTPTQKRTVELNAWCKEDLQLFQRRHCRLGAASFEIAAAGYLFMSYESIMSLGFEKSEAISPLETTNFKEWVNNE
jgi:hypothetical protein